MKVVYFLNCLALVLARPEAGYNYQPPITPNIQYNAPGGTGIGISSLSTGPSSGITGGNIGITGTGTGAISGSYGVPTGGIGNLHRHVYVYTAPQEEETIQQKQITSGPAQKHYKIIFIKAPSFPTYSTAAIQAQAQSQEKTIIYVLAKRPEEIGDITLPTVAPTQPNKPEVYFIRYKTQKTAAQTGQVDGIGISPKYGVPDQSGPY